MSTEPDAFNIKTATEVQLLRHEARRQADGIATRLERLASDMRAKAARLDTSAEPAALIIAEIVNDYTQLGGNVGPSLWGLVRELGRMPDQPSA